MVQVKDAFLSTDNFNFEFDQKGIVQLSFGPTHVCMTLDSALDLQYRLAAFLSHLEMKDYDESEIDDDHLHLEESKNAMMNLCGHHTKKKFDA